LIVVSMPTLGVSLRQMNKNGTTKAAVSCVAAFFLRKWQLM